MRKWTQKKEEQNKKVDFFFPTDPNRLKESIRFVRIRLGDPDPCAVILSLTLTESLVKNCGHYVHLEIATESFMSTLESLYKVSFLQFFSTCKTKKYSTYSMNLYQ